MKSIIISAVFGTAILAIHGVSGAVVPVNALKRNEASGLHSEAVEGVASLAIKRATPDSTASVANSLKFMPVVKRDVSAIDSETGTVAAEDSADESISTATACTHTGEGFLECDGAVFKREIATTSLMNNLEERDETMTNHSIITSLQPRLIPTLADIAARATAADPGCNAKAKPFYFTAPDVCSGEVVKGSVAYQRYYPGTQWNIGLMRLCFERAGCDGGLQFGG
ncbi:MAG: hypothetical protein Q9172_005126 [Xanthocarpia lactea]